MESMKKKLNNLWQNEKSKRILGSASFLLVLAAVIFVIGWACPIYYTFGIPCPGCGMTRALVALLQGNISLSWQYAPMLILSLLWLLTWPLFKDKQKWIIIWAAMTGVCWMIRMVLFFPNDPMPINHGAFLMRILGI